MLLDENFDADAILRDPEEDYFYIDDHKESDEEEIRELELGNPNRLHDLDMVSEDDGEP